MTPRESDHSLLTGALLRYVNARAAALIEARRGKVYPDDRGQRDAAAGVGDRSAATGAVAPRCRGRVRSGVTCGQ